MAADRGILIGWNRVMPGKETQAVALFGEAMAFWGQQQQADQEHGGGTLAADAHHSRPATERIKPTARKSYKAGRPAGFGCLRIFTVSSR